MNYKTVVAVVVYDRFDNMVEWIRCWNLSETQGAQLVIIHNFENEEAKQSYSEFCLAAGIQYIARENKGFDIGAFQDVCRNRLEGFPEYEYLIWCTDDTLPMRKDFISQFIDRFGSDVGSVCMEISSQVKLHIRTTGFSIKKETAERIKFPRDPIISKEDCYQFEHRSNNILLHQINAMGLRSTQICDIPNSPLWDSGNKRTVSRKEEHYLMFQKQSQAKEKVVFICPIYNSYPEIISSLINQTHQNWELLLVHDGPSSMDIKSIVEATKDKRITYIETKVRMGNWGHSIRSEYLEKLRHVDCDFVVITNADNFHAPVYCEYLIKGFTNGQVATYCSDMIHSYTGWKNIQCKLQQGYLDAAGVMVRKEAAVSVGWNNLQAHSADWLYFKELIDKYGEHNFGKVEGTLLIHN